MKTDLPVGAFIIFRYRGMPELWQVVAPLKGMDPREYAIGCVTRPLVPGDVVHRCVWKGTTLVKRNTHTIREGDVTWEKFTHSFGTAVLTHYNSFTKQAPKWMREGNY